MAHGGFINHSEFALEEALYYIHFPDGYVGPATLVQENSSARKTHGDCVIADALTLEEGKVAVLPSKAGKMEPPVGSTGHRMKMILRKKRIGQKRSWRHKYNFTD